MPRIARIVVPGLPHHVSQRGNNREQVFFDDEDRCVFLARLREQAQQHGVAVLAYCLMPNHVHLVVIPQSENALATCMGRTNQRYTTWINRRRERGGHLWQGRFYSEPLDDAHTGNALIYVEQNPVRAGLVRCPWAYRWSSARAHTGRGDESGLLCMEWWGRRWTPGEWERLLGACETGTGTVSG